MRDPSLLVYFRGESGGLVMGGYERNPAPWGLDGIPADFNGRLLAEDWEVAADVWSAPGWQRLRADDVRLRARVRIQPTVVDPVEDPSVHAVVDRLGRVVAAVEPRARLIAPARIGGLAGSRASSTISSASLISRHASSNAVAQTQMATWCRACARLPVVVQIGGCGCCTGRGQTLTWR